MKQKLWENRTRLILAAGTTVVFLFFALISHWTPVSGDDWVYAVGGMWNNPFTQAFHMYQTWSGRYLSELWGFLVAPHKNLWNLLNPLFFTLIFVLLVQLTGGKNHIISTAVLAFLLMCGKPAADADLYLDHGYDVCHTLAAVSDSDDADQTMGI